MRITLPGGKKVGVGGSRRVLATRALRRLTLKGGKKVTLPVRGGTSRSRGTRPGATVRVTLPGGRALQVPPSTKVTLPGGRRMMAGSLQSRSLRRR